MKHKRLLAVAVAAAFALPLAAQASADSDRMIVAQGPAGSSAMGTGPTGGTASPQSAGEPKAPTASGSTAGGTSRGMMDRAPDFSALDKNGDGQISRAEWDAHHRAGSAASGATTAGPGEASPRTAPSSDTATSPSTSGTGKAQ